MGKTPINVCSYNVKGIRDSVKRRKVFYLMHHWKVDICLLQEVHCCLEDEKIWKSEWGGQVFFNHGDRNARGVMILLSKTFPGKIVSVKRDNQGRVLIIWVEINDSIFAIVNLYSPNVDRPQFFIDGISLLDSLESNFKIIAGDFNTVLDLSKDLQGGRGCSNAKTRKFLLEYTVENELVDIWRLRNPEDFRATYTTPHLKERIDFFLISNSMTQLIQSTDIKYISRVSDHAPIMISFLPVSHRPGKGYWKFNNSLLQDSIFREQVQVAIMEVRNNLRHSNPFEVWEMIKLSIREKAIVRSSQLAKSKNNKMQVLEKKIQFLKSQEDNLPLDNSNNEQILLLQTELDELIQYKINGAMLRSGARYYS